LAKKTAHPTFNFGATTRDCPYETLIDVGAILYGCPYETLIDVGAILYGCPYVVEFNYIPKPRINPKITEP